MGWVWAAPPLTITHERIDYMFAPNQDVDRFGNRQLYNEYGMRNRPVTVWGDARRVLVFGDSVLNGGNLTDHESLATTAAMRQTSGIVFANISAGSWGPDNILGWIETYGLLGAETAILVLSSHDAGDAPTFEPLNPATHPTAQPFSALWEGITRYSPQYLPSSIGGYLTPEISLKSRPENQRVGRDGIDVLPEIMTILADEGVRVCVVLHATLSERRNGEFEGINDIAEVLRGSGSPVVQLHEIDSGTTPSELYRDDIHINDAGQLLLAQALLACESAATVPIRGQNQ